MNLSCAVDDLGNPKSTRFHWYRGNELVKDIVTSQWTIGPVGLHSRNNYSCYAVNSGGNGSVATINIDVHVAPAMIRNLPPYTGFLYSEPNINLSCRVECVPSCSIYWFRDGQEITSDDEKYFIRHTNLPADTSTGDFESVLSELVSCAERFTISINFSCENFPLVLQYFCMARASIGYHKGFSELYLYEFKQFRWNGS